MEMMSLLNASHRSRTRKGGPGPKAPKEASSQHGTQQSCTCVKWRDKKTFETQNGRGRGSGAPPPWGLTLDPQEFTPAPAGPLQNIANLTQYLQNVWFRVFQGRDSPSLTPCQGLSPLDPLNVGPGSAGASGCLDLHLDPGLPRERLNRCVQDSGQEGQTLEGAQKREGTINDSGNY